MTSNSQVTHIWYNQSKQHANGSNMFFEGRNIFSYGRHFLMAAHVENKKGQRAVLVTTDSYSVSTSKHQSYVWRAIDDTRQPVFHVSLQGIQGLDTRWLELYAQKFFDEFKDRAAKAAETVKTCRKDKAQNAYAVTYCGLVDEANRFAAFAGLRARIKPKVGLKELAEKRHAEFLAAEAIRNTPEQIAKRLRASERRAELKEAKRQRAIQDWVNGETNHIAWERGDIVYMRVRGDNIETSQGAQFPVDHGKRALPFIIKCRESKTTWETNGHKIPLGHFMIDRIDIDGNVKAGCHYVNFSEIERLAKQLNII